MTEQFRLDTNACLPVRLLTVPCSRGRLFILAAIQSIFIAFVFPKKHFFEKYFSNFVAGK